MINEASFSQSEVFKLEGTDEEMLKSIHNATSILKENNKDSNCHVILYCLPISITFSQKDCQTLP